MIGRFCALFRWRWRFSSIFILHHFARKRGCNATVVTRSPLHSYTNAINCICMCFRIISADMLYIWYSSLRCRPRETSIWYVLITGGACFSDAAPEVSMYQDRVRWATAAQCAILRTECRCSVKLELCICRCNGARSLRKKYVYLTLVACRVFDCLLVNFPSCTWWHHLLTTVYSLFSAENEWRSFTKMCHWWASQSARRTTVRRRTIRTMWWSQSN